MNAIWRWPAPVPAVIVLCSGLACGCGGSGAVIDGAQCVGFDAAGVAASNTVTLQESAASSCDTAAVDVMVTDIADVYASSFTLIYDPAIAGYAGYSTSGSFLAADGASLQVFEDDQPDRVTIGLTRLGSNVGMNAVGAQFMVRLLFSRRAASGAAAVSFQDLQLLGSETPPQAKSGYQSLGGTLVVR